MPKAPQIAVWVKFSSADVMLQSLRLWTLMQTLLETDVCFFGGSPATLSIPISSTNAGKVDAMS